ncbi:hypothetical protein M0R45_025795 [Rubus argutus]|uniref:Transposase-associated domain-containing protein n=1 Tax=Rubus argutus TaxID=59490 RepID=A0AAW1WVT2_RUBAR
MDKSWIDLANRWSQSYLDGIDGFLTFAYINRDQMTRIYCPCRKCENHYLYVRLVVRQHLRDNGFWKKYKKWDKHGESKDNADTLGTYQNDIVTYSYMEDDMVRLVQEALGTPNVGPHDQNDGESSTNPRVGPDEPTKFLKLMEGANRPLYPGSKRHTALSYIVRILQAKVLHGWTDSSFKTLLEISAEEFMPEDFAIHLDGKIMVEIYMMIVGPVKRRAAKQARYFPLKPRLQRLYMSSKTAKLMRWHGEERTDDGVFRHPAVSLAWKDFDNKHISFSKDIRNASYMTHRRWLPYDHKYRADPRSFNGKTEYRLKPKILSGIDINAQLKSNGILTEYKREDLERRNLIHAQKPDNDPLKKKKHNWKKRSIFFELPYWRHNLIRHNLDVMHIEKNVCDNVLWTILGVAGKTKDNMKLRRDLELMGIREQYHLKMRESGTEYTDPTKFEMNNKGKRYVLSALSVSRMPDGAASNIARRVHLQDRNIGGLKSHDNHILLQ